MFAPSPEIGSVVVVFTHLIADRRGDSGASNDDIDHRNAPHPSAMNDPTLDAARATIRESMRSLLDDLDIPVTGSGIDDLTLDGLGILELRIDPDAFDDVTLARAINQIRGLGFGVDAVEHVRVTSHRIDPGSKIHPDGIDHLIAITGAKGGVGRTTLTASLAWALADRGLAVGIFDCDVSKGDLVTYLGIDTPIHATPDGRPAPIEIDGVQVVSVDLVAGERPVVWRGAMVHDVLVDLLGNAAWSDRDVVLLDFPPGIGDAVYTTLQEVALDGAVLVGAPTALAEEGCVRSRSLLAANDIPILAEVTMMVGEDGPYDGGRADTEFSIPFDRDLQTFDRWPETFATATEAGLGAVATAIEQSISASADPADGVVELRGFPPGVACQQAELEVADAPDGPPPLAVDDSAVQDHLTETFGDGTITGIDELDDGLLLHLHD